MWRKAGVTDNLHMPVQFLCKIFDALLPHGPKTSSLLLELESETCTASRYLGMSNCGALHSWLQFALIRPINHRSSAALEQIPHPPSLSLTKIISM
ncbi:hypothetical protein HBI56_149600 [Parastagonospora nodorum]|uniref:Uncharacterized protein n=1 Tax=Phaeosphaeria nodorum (strain SN15 / ATCC MYA-4574 / FGSC 10173) TaxID=321614 RepID=A0A7U2IBI8_PHANO|nr:hypothetical protein HBH56_075260 [Parastagonospora nodorum]QRD06802.1 hypothetical protein JI435_423730 [Parastagonospora nodorum SN15]KAH3927349.1 hypothetical protein HBH54_155500 [Parastagonospora nodorum]KAH3951875.1 hypothetical protein HBH53_052900 [Parastagonospora nodorum]KAH3981857.1 hypothetical protein HBH51_042210 [Parastagonospora nodorum]